MGWIKDAKVDNVRKDAVDARNEGRNVLALKLNYPSLKPDFSGEVTVWSMMIQAVEEEGWVLCNFAASSDLKGRQEAICLFRSRTQHP